MNNSIGMNIKHIALCIVALFICNNLFCQKIYISINDSNLVVGQKLLFFDSRYSTNIIFGGHNDSYSYTSIYDTLQNFFKRNLDCVFEIGVFSDCRGDSLTNINLTNDLALIVFTHLTNELKLPCEMFNIKGYGSSVPFTVDSNIIFSGSIFGRNDSLNIEKFFPIGTVLNCEYLKKIDPEFYRFIDGKNLPLNIKVAYRFNRRIEFKVISIKP